MKIFRAVERGMEIPENLDELVFPEDVKELEDKAENQETEILSHIQQKPLFQPMSFPGRKKL